jgi:hypothetical protein
MHAGNQNWRNKITHTHKDLTEQYLDGSAFEVAQIKKNPSASALVIALYYPLQPRFVCQPTNDFFAAAAAA